MLDDFTQRLYWIDNLGVIPSRCIERVDTVHGSRAIFHGCYDWHSSVHGHWAIFRTDLAGTGKNHELAVKASRRLTVDKINAVIRELQSEPAFEMPYGKAWLLRLTVEYEKWVEQNNAELPSNWKQLGDYVTESLIDYYLGNSGNVLNIYSNQYRNDSFSIVQLHDYLQYRGEEEKLKKMLDYVSKYFLTKSLYFDPKLESDPNAFLSPFWSWVYLLVKTQPIDTLINMINVKELRKDLLSPVVQGEADPKKVHHYGINWSRAWAIKALTKSISSMSLEYSKILITAYHNHIKQGLNTHEEYSRAHPDIEEKESYYSYYHWVPQFAIYALTE
jgi:hypothetical protein